MFNLNWKAHTPAPEVVSVGKRASVEDGPFVPAVVEESPAKRFRPFMGWGGEDETMAQGVIEGVPAPGQGVIELDDDDSWGTQIKRWFQPPGSRSPTITGGSSSQDDGDIAVDAMLAELSSGSYHGEDALADAVDIDSALMELDAMEIAKGQNSPKFRVGCAAPLACCVAPRKKPQPRKQQPPQPKKTPQQRFGVTMATQKPLIKMPAAQPAAPKPAPKPKPKPVGLGGLVWKQSWTPEPK